MMFAFKFEMAFYTGLVAEYNIFPTTCFELNILERMELELNLDTEIITSHCQNSEKKELQELTKADFTKNMILVVMILSVSNFLGNRFG